MCRRRASTTALAALACLLLATVFPASAQTDILPGECATLPFDFNWQNFDYTARFSSPGNLTDGCIFRITRLYMQGTCTSERNNGGSGCASGSNGTTVSGSACQAVFADAPSGTIQTPPVPGSGYAFDSGSLCTQSDIGYFFAFYNCSANATQPGQLPTPLRFDVALSYKKYSGGCSGSTFPYWTRYFLGVLCAMLAVVLLAFAFKRCMRRPQPAPAAVQLAPPGGTAGSGYYTGSAAYGAGQPGGQPAYAGAWGATPAGYPPSGAGYQGGYGAPGYYAAPSGYGTAAPPPPVHYPPPMTTVTLGQPGEDGSTTAAANGGAGAPNAAAPGGAALNAAGYPLPGSTAAGQAPNVSDSQSKV